MPDPWRRLAAMCLYRLSPRASAGEPVSGKPIIRTIAAKRIS